MRYFPCFSPFQEFRIIEEFEYCVRPYCRPGKLDDRLVKFAGLENASLLHESVFRDGCNNVTQDGVSWFGLDGPLAELYTAEYHSRQSSRSGSASMPMIKPIDERDTSAGIHSVVDFKAKVSMSV
jgi:hypothetical protein